MNILKNIVRVGLIVTALSFNLVSCDYLDVVPPEQAGLQDATKTRRSTLGFCSLVMQDFRKMILLLVTQVLLMVPQMSLHCR